MPRVYAPYVQRQPSKARSTEAPPASAAQAAQALHTRAVGPAMEGVPAHLVAGMLPGLQRQVGNQAVAAMVARLPREGAAEHAPAIQRSLDWTPARLAGKSGKGGVLRSKKYNRVVKALKTYWEATNGDGALDTDSVAGRMAVTALLKDLSAACRDWLDSKQGKDGPKYAAVGDLLGDAQAEIMALLSKDAGTQRGGQNATNFVPMPPTGPAAGSGSTSSTTAALPRRGNVKPSDYGAFPKMDGGNTTIPQQAPQQQHQAQHALPQSGALPSSAKTSAEGWKQAMGSKSQAKLNLDAPEQEDIFWYFSGAFQNFYEKELNAEYTDPTHDPAHGIERWDDFHKAIHEGKNPKGALAEWRRDLGDSRGEHVKGLSEQERASYELKPTEQKNAADDKVFYWGKEQKPYVTSEMRTLTSGGQGGRAIFVMTSDGKVYSADMVAEYYEGLGHDGAKITKGWDDRWIFHHSSFLAGKPVAAAGELEFDSEGSLVAVSDASGHYRPSSGYTVQLLKHFAAIGVDISRIFVNIFELKDKAGITRIPATTLIDYMGDVDRIAKEIKGDTSTGLQDKARTKGEHASDDAALAQGNRFEEAWYLEQAFAKDQQPATAWWAAKRYEESGRLAPATELLAKSLRAAPDTQTRSDILDRSSHTLLSELLRRSKDPILEEQATLDAIWSLSGDLLSTSPARAFTAATFLYDSTSWSWPGHAAFRCGQAAEQQGHKQVARHWYEKAEQQTQDVQLKADAQQKLAALGGP